MASMRSAAEDTYKGKLDRMGLGISTASTGAKGRGDVYPQDDGSQGMSQGKRAEGYETEEANEKTLDDKEPKKLRLDRKGFKHGGAVKKKGGTTVNVIVAPQKDAGPPGIPPALAAAAMQKPPMPPMAPPSGAGGPPPGMGGPDMPPPMMGRKAGGRVPHMTAGAGSGEGRLEKIKEYGANAKPHRASGGRISLINDLAAARKKEASAWNAVDPENTGKVKS